MLRMTNKDKSAATWSDVKAKLGDFDRAGLLGLVQDLYTTSKDNQNFLHARFGLGCERRGRGPPSRCRGHRATAVKRGAEPDGRDAADAA